MVFKYLIDNPVIFLVIYITVEQFSFNPFHLLTDPSSTIRPMSSYIFINFLFIELRFIY